MTIMETLPPDPMGWRRWLEDLVVSPQLDDLVQELDVPQPKDRPRTTLAMICGDALPQVLQKGLSVLSDRQITQLLDHPRALFELQEQAFEACSPYWDKLAAETASAQASSQTTAGSPSTVETKKDVRDSSAPTGRTYWAVIALAAALLLAVGVWFNRQQPTSTGWGLTQISTLSPDLKDSTYLLRISELAAQWSNKQPADGAALVKRLREFRAGCQVLIEHPKPQLKPTEREWLVTKCEKWAGDIDQLISRLESEQITFEDGLKEAGGIAKRMETVLRDKALELS